MQIAGQIAQGFAGGRQAIAVAGITAAGKSSFANVLSLALSEHCIAVLRASIDDFHHPVARRNRDDMPSALAYLHHAHDLTALQTRLLAPFTNGAPTVQTASLDLARDQAVDPPPTPAPEACVLVIDGTFLLKPELRPYWASSVWLDTAYEQAAARGAARDAKLLGGLDQARQRYETRYHAACKQYVADCALRAAATWVIE